MAAKCAEGWRVKATRDYREVAIKFADHSAAKVGPTTVEIVIDGADVRLFETAYQPHVFEPQLADSEPADPDPELEIEPHLDDEPGF